MVAAAVDQGHRWICPRCDIVSQDWVVRAHRVGLLVYVYHVNDRDTAERIAAWGADAIGTDFPEIALHLCSPGGVRRRQG
jgi:glycerophosphoryl diester phosphodiesterase